MTDPGYTTTEFWLTLATNALALVAILHPGYKAPPGLAQALAAVAAGIGTVAYSFSRGQVKSSAALAVPASTGNVSKDATVAATLRAAANALDPPA